MLRDELDECLCELARCGSEVHKLEEEYRQFKIRAPQGEAEGLLMNIGYWKGRRDKADARCTELNELMKKQR